MRLTKKESVECSFIVSPSFREPGPCEVYFKLQQLEDIEDELGIDLKVYHKLMDMLYCGEPNILYVKDKDMIIQVGVLEIDYCKKKLIFYKDKSYNDDYVYGFIQYGKTWALTKEELL